MAGTRLLVHTLFLVQIFVLSLWSLFRIRRDVILPFPVPSQFGFGVDRSGLEEVLDLPEEAIVREEDQGQGDASTIVDDLVSMLGEAMELLVGGDGEKKPVATATPEVEMNLTALGMPTPKEVADSMPSPRVQLHVTTSYLRDVNDGGSSASSSPSSPVEMMRLLRGEMSAKLRGHANDDGRARHDVAVVTIHELSVDVASSLCGFGGKTTEAGTHDDSEARDELMRRLLLASRPNEEAVEDYGGLRNHVYPVVILDGCGGDDVDNGNAVVRIEIDHFGGVVAHLPPSRKRERRSLQSLIPPGLIDAVDSVLYPVRPRQMQRKQSKSKSRPQFAVRPMHEIVVTLSNEDPSSHASTSSSNVTTSQFHLSLGKSLSDSLDRTVVPFARALLEETGLAERVEVDSRSVALLSLKGTKKRKTKGVVGGGHGPLDRFYDGDDDNDIGAATVPYWVVDSQTSSSSAATKFLETYRSTLPPPSYAYRYHTMGLVESAYEDTCRTEWIAHVPPADGTPLFLSGRGRGGGGGVEEELYESWFSATPGADAGGRDLGVGVTIVNLPPVGPSLDAAPPSTLSSDECTAGEGGGGGQVTSSSSSACPGSRSEGEVCDEDTCASSPAAPLVEVERERYRRRPFDDTVASALVSHLRESVGLSTSTSASTPSRIVGRGGEDDASVVVHLPPPRSQSPTPLLARWEAEGVSRYWLPEKFEAAADEIGLLLRMMVERQHLPVSREVGLKMKAAIQCYRAAADMAQRGRTRDSTHEINASLLLAGSVRSDPTMLENQHVPDEHLLAVFSPLLLPLILPLVLGFVREAKRYKKLTHGAAAKQDLTSSRNGK